METMTVEIYEDIGPAPEFARAVSNLPAGEDVTFRINSCGGDVFGGMAIIAAITSLRKNGHKTRAVIEGLAASMASVVACACDEIAMHEGAMMMIHNPWTTDDIDRYKLDATVIEGTARIAASVAKAAYYAHIKHRHDMTDEKDKDEQTEEQKPVEETPVEETPVVETPVEEKPAEEQPEQTEDEKDTVEKLRERITELERENEELTRPSTPSSPARRSRFRFPRSPPRASTTTAPTTI